MPRRLWLVGLVFVAAAAQAIAGQNRIDGITPMAPEFAAYGSMPVGVRTISATDRSRVDILNTKSGGAVARRDRTLTVEVWYPAVRAAGQAAGGEYRTTSRDPSRAITLHGKAARDAAPDASRGRYPS